MTTTEDRLRAALHARAELVSLPAHNREPERQQARGRRVFVAAAAAVTVAAVVTVVTVTAHVSSTPVPAQTVSGPGSVQPMSESPLTRRELASAAWTGSKLLIWGGSPFSARTGAVPDLNDGALYDPATDAWQPAPADPATSAANLPSATATVGSVVYSFGVQRQPNHGSYASVPVSSRFDPATSVWSTLPAPSLCATAALAVGGRIDVAGFNCNSMATSRVPVWASYDTATGQWTTGTQA